VTEPFVESILRDELADRRGDVAAVDERLLPQVDRLARFVLDGGKRLRPRFLWCGWLAGGGELDGPRAQAARRAGAAIELIQAGALVHDDIIDNSSTRRGKPSLHVDLGVDAAILLGDLVLSWADDLFADASAVLGAGAAVRDAWRKVRTEVLAGQLLDLAVSRSSQQDPVVQARDARRVNRFKTAAYTVERPLQLGAALADADPRVIGALRGYGAHLGLAFQLRDDLLGVFGDAVVTGKPAGGDLIEGKRTVLLATARTRLRAHPEQLARLDADVGRDSGPAVTAALAQIIAGSGAVEAVEDEIEALVTSGLAALDGASLPEPVLAELRELASAATSRAF